MSFFISDAIASAGAPAGQSDGIVSMAMMVAIFVLFYFMLIRPQSKRAKEQREMTSQLKKGDEIIASGGLLGKITQVDEQYIRLSLAPNDVEIVIQRSSVASVLPKGTLKSL